MVKNCKTIPEFTTEIEKVNWISDLYNSDNAQVYTWNTGDDPTTCAEWLRVSMGVLVSFMGGLIKISHYAPIK